MAKESAAISDRATVLYEKFGNVQPLPMIPIRTQEGKEYTPGIKKLQELIDNRIKKVNNDLSLEEVFKDEASLKKNVHYEWGSHALLDFFDANCYYKN